MKSFLDLATKRHSIRKYKKDALDEAMIARILEAGRLAPSGNNSQPWRFIVVNEDSIKKNLFEVAGKQPWILDAPITIAVVADMTAKMKSEFKTTEISIDDPEARNALIKSVRDAAIAADHIVMAATDEGLGTCWIALYEQEDIRPILDVPDHCYVVSIITIGYADEEPGPRPRHPISDIASWNSFERDPFTCVK